MNDINDIINDIEFTENYDENFGQADLNVDSASTVAKAVEVVERNGYFVTQN